MKATRQITPECIKMFNEFSDDTDKQEFLHLYREFTHERLARLATDQMSQIDALQGEVYNLSVLLSKFININSRQAVTTFK